MMALTSILNPLEDKSISSPLSSGFTPAPPPRQHIPTHQTRCIASSISPSGDIMTVNKRQKLSRSWSSRPLLLNEHSSGSPSEESMNVRYPPCAIITDHVREKHIAFKVSPAAHEIMSSKRRIPYASDKKDFFQKTGREAFEVFSYDFNKPGDSKTYTIMWDYETGLVRTTAIFKACGFQKTTPAKMLQSNPGLKELCYSITGGALAAQGYWIPYAAAKAVSATFAYEIREALTPVFGLDFVELCIPKSSMEWAHMQIPRALIQQCAVDAEQLFEEQLATKKDRFATDERKSGRTDAEDSQQRHVRNGPHLLEAAKRATYLQPDSSPLKRAPQYYARPSLPIPPSRTGSRSSTLPFSSPSSSFSTSLRHHHSHTQGPAPARKNTLQMILDHPVPGTRAYRPPGLRPRPTPPALQVVTSGQESRKEERAARMALYQESPTYPLSVKTPDTTTPTISSATSSDSIYSSGSSYASSRTTTATTLQYEPEEPARLPWETQLMPPASASSGFTCEVHAEMTPDQDLLAAAILMQGVKEDMERAEEKRRREKRTRELERELELLKAASKL